MKYLVKVKVTFEDSITLEAESEEAARLESVDYIKENTAETKSISILSIQKL